MSDHSWLEIRRGALPLVMSLPHVGTDIPTDIESTLVSPWLARKDTDWWLRDLYAFAREMDITILSTRISRTVIDVNRDPAGKSLYPGQATTDLCPATTFDGELLYREGQAPQPKEVARRRDLYFAPYHAALSSELTRLRQHHDRVVLYDAHSIRSAISRLFPGRLPNLNLGTNSDQSCDAALQARLAMLCGDSSYSHVVNGRFKGGYITRHYGQPQVGVHAVQMEIACRTYLREPDEAVDASNWPTKFDPDFASPLSQLLTTLFDACIDFAKGKTI